MAFNRKFLIDNGVPEENVEIILAERSRTLNNYVAKDEAEEAQKEAVKKALEEAESKQKDISKHPEYLKLDGEFQSFKKKTEARNSDSFKSVKGKFFDSVYDRLDHSKDYAEQLEGLKKEYGEYFSEEKEDEKETPPAKNSPVFSKQPGREGDKPTAADALKQQFSEQLFGKS